MKTALVLKWMDTCPHCQRTMQSLPDLMDALQGYSGSLGVYLYGFHDGQTQRVTRDKKGMLHFSTDHIPPRSATVRRLIEQVEGVPMLLVFQDERSPLKGKKVASYQGFQSSKEFNHVETIHGDQGELPLGEILARSAPPKKKSKREEQTNPDKPARNERETKQDKPTRKERKTRGNQNEKADKGENQGGQDKPTRNERKTQGNQNEKAQGTTQQRNRDGKPDKNETAETRQPEGGTPGNEKEKRKPPAYLEQERQLIQASKEAVTWVEKRFSARNRGNLTTNPMVRPFLDSVRQWVLRPGNPLAGLLLLREGCLYCEQAKEVFQGAEKMVADRYHVIPSLAMYTFSSASQDPGGQEELIAALKQWGVDSFPVILLMQADRDGSLEVVASIDKDKNTSNPQVWEKFLLATLLPGQAARRQRQADKDPQYRLGGMSYGDPGTALFQDDIGRVAPAMLAEHANWDMYDSMESFGKAGNEKKGKATRKNRASRSNRNEGGD